MGSRIAGRYELLERLGQGGMGTVFRARDHSLRREVAIKFPRLDDGDTDAHLRFRQEFHTLARMAHPRIVAAHEYGVDATGPYYTMELLGGEDLRSLAPVDPMDGCRLLRDVASALAFLHARGLIHRDVAGRNVRCAVDGRAKLIDFGALTTVGVVGPVIGTPPFISPEALRGQPLDPRSDLFSLGAVAYRLLTGRHAYPAQEPSDLFELWQRSPPAPSVHNEAVPESLDELVLSLMSLDIMARPTSAAEVIDRLRAIGQLEPSGELDAARRTSRARPWWDAPTKWAGSVSACAGRCKGAAARPSSSRPRRAWARVACFASCRSSPSLREPRWWRPTPMRVLRAPTA
jgi:eukaryotic-like serine/threonine-protein kinase